MRFNDWRLPHNAYVLALRRLVLTDSGVPQVCRIRKCRRDGACTGPLVVEEGGEVWLESEDAARNRDIDGRIAPVCTLHLSLEGWEAFNDCLRRRFAFFSNNPDCRIRLKDKAVRANSRTSVNGIRTKLEAAKAGVVLGQD